MNLLKIFEDKDNRIKIFAILLVVLYCILLIKILFVLLAKYEVDGGRGQLEQSLSITKKYNILDRNGELLATTVRSYDFYISPSRVIFPDEMIKKLNLLFPDLITESIKSKIKSKTNRLVLIKKEITEEQKDAIIKSGIEASEFEKSSARVYPFGSLFAHIVGYVNSGFEGVFGLERSQNERLQYEDITTSLDARVQANLHFHLSKILEEYRAKSGFGIALNILNGEIISLVSLPDFDPKNIINPNGEEMKNTAISSSYEPGSVLKVVTVAMGLANGLNENQTFKVSDQIRLDRNFVLKDEHIKKPNLKMSEILAFSSNVGSAKILEEVGLEKQREFYDKIGLFKTPKLEISPFEVATPLYKPDKWAKSMHYTMAYGYGTAVSPLQFSNIMRTIIGTGKQGNLTLIKNNKEQEGDVILTQKQVSSIQNMIKEVIEIGTAQTIKRKNGYEICGKTSTTYKYDKSTRQWSNTKRMIAFVGFFPCHNPRYLIFMGLDEPHPKNGKPYNTVQGGSVIAPAMADVISEIAPILNIKPDALSK
jgi:cell division protein FtsI (penicillin-binding protein 3)